MLLLDLQLLERLVLDDPRDELLGERARGRFSAGSQTSSSAPKTE